MADPDTDDLVRLPDVGDRVRLFPAPAADGAGKRRKVQDGAGNFGRFLPDAGGERVFDPYWHDRLMAGDVLITDPAKSYAHAASNETPAAKSAAPEATSDAPPPASSEPPASAPSATPAPSSKSSAASKGAAKDDAR